MSEQVVYFGAGSVSIETPRNLVTVTDDDPVQVLVNSTNIPLTSVFNIATFSNPGTLAVDVGKSRLPFGANARILGVMASVYTAPVGADIVIDLNVNGSSVFQPGNRPVIADGGIIGTEARIIELPNVNEGDYMSIDIDQVGSSTPGDFLMVAVRFSYL